MIIIPTPEKILTGGIYEFFRNDLELTKSFKELMPDEYKKFNLNNNALKAYSISEEDFEQILKVRRDEGLSTLTFWQIIQDIVLNKSAYAQFNDYVGVYNMEVYLEILVSELTSPVPVGMHNSTDENDNQLNWIDWNAGGDQPLATSLDNTKCIVRTNINNIAPNMDELLILGAYCQGNPNRTILNQYEVKQLMNSVDYYNE